MQTEQILSPTPPAPAALPPTPYVVVCDSREKKRYAFAQPFRPPGTKKILAVRTTVAALPSGDYSVCGLELQVAVERKSLADLYTTLGQGRDRFYRELERLATYTYAAVVVEAEWSAVLTAPPPRSQLRPRSVFGSVLAWQQRFTRVHWLFMPGREVAEATTLRVLDRFWLDEQVRQAQQAQQTSLKMERI